MIRPSTIYHLNKLERTVKAESDKTKELPSANPKVKDLGRKKQRVSKTMLRRSIKSKMVWWNNLTRNEQKSYLDEHPKSKLPLKKSVTPTPDKKVDDAEKTTKNAEKSEKQKGDSKERTEAVKIAPLTKNEKTTKLYKVDIDAINKVPAGEQQTINKIIEDAYITPHEAEDSSDATEDTNVKPSNSKHKYKKPDDNENNKGEDEEPDSGSQDDLNEKVSNQLHPKQKLNFLKAAKVLVSKKATKEEKAEAAKSLSHLSALATLTKICGAGSLAAAAYYFGSAPAAQTAIFFALHHGEHLAQNSTAKDYLRKWAHKRFTGDLPDEKDNDKDFDRLLGIYEHRKERQANNSNHKHKKHHSGGHSHRKHH